MNNKEERRTYGAHLTSVEIFKEFILPKIKDKLEQFAWIDLFAGEGNLILPILELIPTERRIEFFKEHIFLFDILKEMTDKATENAEKYGIPKDVAQKNILQKDTIKDYPEFILKLKYPPFHITNPPYLYLGYIRKHKETKKYFEYFTKDNKGYQDLYQLGLINDLRHGIKNMIYIIPSNFFFGFSISNKIRNDLFKFYTIKEAIIFERRIFEFTGANVVICLFERKVYPHHAPIKFEAIKINKKHEKRNYVLKPTSNYRAGGEFEEFVENFKSSKPLKVKYYLTVDEIEKNKGNCEIKVIDINKYENKSIFVNEEMYRKIMSNILFIRTLDTGSMEGRAGLYTIQDVLKIDAILVTKDKHRVHPIHVFLEPTLSKEEQIVLKDYFNLILEHYRKVTDSEFLTTFLYSNSKYIRKYLGLSQTKKLIQTFPLLSLTSKEKNIFIELVKEKNVDKIIKFMTSKESSQTINKFLQ